MSGPGKMLTPLLALIAIPLMAASISKDRTIGGTTVESTPTSEPELLIVPEGDEPGPAAELPPAPELFPTEGDEPAPPAAPEIPADLPSPIVEDPTSPEERANMSDVPPPSNGRAAPTGLPVLDFTPKSPGRIAQSSTWVLSDEADAEALRFAEQDNELRKQQPHELHFVGGIQRPSPGLDARVVDRMEAAEELRADLSQEVTYGFLMTRQRMTDAQARELDALGVKIFNRHPYRSWKVRVPLDRVAQVVALPWVRWFGYADRDQKLDPKLQIGLSGSPRSTERNRFYVHVFDDDSSPDSFEVPLQFGSTERLWFHSNGPMEKALVEAGFVIDYFDRTLFMFVCEGSHQGVNQILENDWVHFVEYEPEAQLHLDQSSPLVQADEFWAGSYDGNSVTVGVIDSGCFIGGGGHTDLNHINSCGANYTGVSDAWTDEVGHGTHVAGIIASNADCSSGKFPGQADGIGNGSPLHRMRIAKCFTSTSSFNLADAMDWMEVDSPGSCTSTFKAHVVNNSWGNACYTSAPVGTDGNSLKADEQVYYENIVMVFSAGNGRDANCNGFTDYWGSGSIGTPGAAKNVLTVGSCNDETQNIVGDQTWFSSEGSTGDGRFKPDINAPGCDDETQTVAGTGNEIWAPDSDSSCDMIDRCGTSMAAPHVTGSIATLMEHYTWMKDEPSLVKAWLMARSIPHNNSLASSRNQYGAGRLDSYVAHYNSDTANGWSGGSWNGDITSTSWSYFDVTVPADTDRMVIVLAWDEWPASSGASDAVLYDLDLYCDYAPFSGSGNVGDYSSTSVANNVEMIRIDNPLTGSMRMKVYNYDAPGFPFPALRANVSYFFVRGDTSPTTTHNLALSSTDTSVKPNTSFNVTATASVGSWIASCLQAEVQALPSGVSITDLDAVREDGTNFDYDANDDELTLGDVRYGDSRSATWTFTSTTEGNKTISIDTDTDNASTQNETILIQVDGTAPGLPSWVTQSPPLNTWSNDNTVFVDWNPATDDRTGVDGYGEYWSVGGPGAPGNTKDLEEFQTSTTSAPLADGTHYYNLKTVDNAGNWTASYTSRGPFLIDTTQPNLVTSLASTSHSVGVWSGDNTVAFGWTQATDNLSGIDGYGVFESNGAPGLPSAIKDIEQVTSYTTPALGTGSAWYFNIRSVDNAGNWDADYASAGPYLIDVTAPGSVPGVTSTSHTIASYNNDPTINMAWNAATDAHSGLAGYSYFWSNSAPGTPDTIVDTAGLNHTSPALGDGTWWFHIRAVDNVGNGGPTAVVGPYLIDSTVPTNPTISSTSHVPGVCSTDCTVDVEWSGASGSPYARGISGVDGYSILWTTSPSSVPDLVIDTALESATSACLSSGSWYFHLRTADNAGNWSGAIHYGPFDIDTSAPPTPTGLVSITHAIASWSTDNVVKVGWNPVVDTGCGLTGYSIVWDQNAATVPDGVADIPAGDDTNTSPALADGNGWYFHIRSVDQAGLLSGAAHIGPFWIDATSPTTTVTFPNGGESLQGGEEVTITFNANDPMSGLDAIRVFLSTDGGSSWPEVIYNGAPPGGNVAWTVPEYDTDTARIQVLSYDVAGNQGGDTSNSNFSIGTTTSVRVMENVDWSLQPAAPNPVRSSATIAYSIAQEANVQLEVFDTTGRRISSLVSKVQPAGRHQVTWNGRDQSGQRVSSGLYFYRMQAGTFSATGRMVVLR